MIAVLINCAAVVVGSLFGLLIGKKLNDNFKTVVFSCSGLITIAMGIQMALETTNFLALLISLLIGGFLGYWLKIEDRVLSLGDSLAKLSKSSTGGFAHGFMNASVLFCSGAMAVVGSIQAGTTGDIQTILIKSVMDGCMAVVFTTVYGIGVMFSIISVFIYQGFFTIAGGYLQPIMGEVGITELSAAGGIMLMMIGSNLINVKEFKTANYLPSLIFAPVLGILAGKIF